MNPRNYRSLSVRFIAQLAFVAATGSAVSAATLVPANPGSVVLNRVHRSSPHIAQLSAQDYYNRALARYVPSYKHEDIKGMIDDITKAIKLKPDFANAYSFRAILKYEDSELHRILPGLYDKCNVGTKQEALNDYERSRALDPGNSNAYVFSSLRNSRNLKETIADLNESIAVDPSNSIAYLKRASVLSYKGDHKGVLADYDKLISLNPSNYKIYSKRAGVKRILHDYQGVLADYDKVIALNPSDYETYSQRASVKQIFEDYEGALSDHDKAVVGCMGCLISRARFKEQLKNYRGALADYDKLIALPSSYLPGYGSRGIFYHWRGILKYEKLKNRSGGISDLRQAARRSRLGRDGFLEISLKKLREWGVSE
jgi:tetratricopeptide (TPR) repeat protein